MFRLFIAGVLFGGTAWTETTNKWVDFSDDAREVVVRAPGVSVFKGSSLAVYSVDGKNCTVGINGDQKIGSVCETTDTTPFGDAVVRTVTFGSDTFQYSLKLKRLQSLHAFTVQAVFHNHSDRDVKLLSFNLLDLRQGSGGDFVVADPADWLVTPLMDDFPAQALSVMDTQLNEAAMIYHSNGDGFLAGPVGSPDAFALIQLGNQTFKAEVEMNVLVRAGESRCSQEMIFSFEPLTTSTDIWTRWVAITHGALLNKGPIDGWCSWYDRRKGIDEAHMRDVTEVIKDNPNVFGRGCLIQLDDGYQKMQGDWDANGKFPSGMAALAASVRHAGFLPGLWVAPLRMNRHHPWLEKHPDSIQRDADGRPCFTYPKPWCPDDYFLNPADPESKKFLYDVVHAVREQGFGYIKIDFNGVSSRAIDPTQTKTRLQVFRELYALYREAVGEDMYFLSCLTCGKLGRGVIGFVDAVRIAPDSDPLQLSRCLKSVLRYQIYNGVWWHNDPDVSYLEPELKSRTGYKSMPYGDDIWKTWHAAVCLVGGTAVISEPVNMPDAQAVWRNYEIMRPASREPARLLTLGRSPDNMVFGFTADRPFGNFAVYNLYNPSENDQRLTLNFKETGLPQGIKCAVFDFWSNQVVGFVEGSYTTSFQPPHASALLRITPLVDLSRPVLIGSNLHLSIGATEIGNLRVLPDEIIIDFSSAGAQDGILTFYSQRPLQSAGSENCHVTAVEDLGDNVWHVHLSGRQWGKEQSICLKVD
jgi:hypothetical protein